MTGIYGKQKSMGLNKTIHILPLPQSNRLKPIAGLNTHAVK